MNAATKAAAERLWEILRSPDKYRLMSLLLAAARLLAALDAEEKGRGCKVCYCYGCTCSCHAPAKEEK